MVVATFGPTTAWLGRTITFENDAFVLQDHGPISAGDVMAYDQPGASRLGQRRDTRLGRVEGASDQSRSCAVKRRVHSHAATHEVGTAGPGLERLVLCGGGRPCSPCVCCRVWRELRGTGLLGALLRASRGSRRRHPSQSPCQDHRAAPLACRHDSRRLWLGLLLGLLLSGGLQQLVLRRPVVCPGLCLLGLGLCRLRRPVCAGRARRHEGHQDGLEAGSAGGRRVFVPAGGIFWGGINDARGGVPRGDRGRRSLRCGSAIKSGTPRKQGSLPTAPGPPRSCRRRSGRGTHRRGRADPSVPQEQGRRANLGRLLRRRSAVHERHRDLDAAAGPRHVDHRQT